VEEDMTEFLGTDGGQIAYEVTGLTDPARPSSSWRYRIDPLPGGGSRVRQRFTHGPGASYLRAVAAKAPDRAAEIIAARRDGLRANMTATLRAMKAATES
jgi:hypothetical protein